jgi:hypothetical protein
MNAIVASPNVWSRWRLLLPWVFAARFSYALKWARVSLLSQERRFEEALRVHRSIPENLRPPMSWALREIQILAWLQWDHETIDAVNAFLQKFEYPTASTDDRKYFLMYARWCGAIAFAHYAPESPKPSAFEFDASEIDLDKVHPRYKREYPMTVHPAWAEDSPFRTDGLLKRPPPRPPMRS